MSFLNPFLSSAPASSPRIVPVGTFRDGRREYPDLLEESGVFHRPPRGALPRGVARIGTPSKPAAAAQEH
jgi:hypothetical protein